MNCRASFNFQQTKSSCWVVSKGDCRRLPQIRRIRTHFTFLLSEPTRIERRVSMSLMPNSIAPLRGMLRQLWNSGRRARLQNILLSIEEKIHRRSTIEAVLEALDASKQPIFECLSKRAKSSIASKALTLKILNLLLCKYHLLARNSVVLSRPFGLAVDPSNVCNLACPGCVHSLHAKEQRLFI